MVKISQPQGANSDGLMVTLALSIDTSGVEHVAIGYTPQYLDGLMRVCILLQQWKLPYVALLIDTSVCYRLNTTKLMSFHSRIVQQTQQ